MIQREGDSWKGVRVDVIQKGRRELQRSKSGCDTEGRRELERGESGCDTEGKETVGKG